MLQITFLILHVFFFLIFITIILVMDSSRDAVNVRVTILDIKNVALNTLQFNFQVDIEYFKIILFSLIKPLTFLFICSESHPNHSTFSSFFCCRDEVFGLNASLQSNFLFLGPKNSGFVSSDHARSHALCKAFPVKQLSHYS